MKNIKLVLAAVMLSSLSFAQITVPEVQKSLYGSVDATWCGNCGNFGIPTTTSIYSQTNDKAVFFEMHKSASSNLHSDVAATLATAFGSISQPQVTLNGILQGNLNPGIEAQIVTDINTNYNATTTDVNAGFEWLIENDSLYVTTNTKFFTDLNGEYYTAVYVTEDSIWEFQANYNPNIPDGDIFHFHILRDVLSSNAFGIETGNGAITNGQEIEVMHKMKLDPEWDLNNIHINTVVWKKNGSTYSFLNANNVGVEGQSTASIAELNIVEIEVYPNPATDFISIRTNETTTGTIQIFSQQGMLISEIVLNHGTTDINVSEFESGLYFIGGVTPNGNIKTQKFIKN